MNRWATFLIVAFIAAVLLALTGCAPRDDTDPAGGRSGMWLYTDARTGCDYLALYGWGGVSITPRMDRDGKQVCK